MNDLRRWMMVAQTLCEAKINNTGKLGELEAALAMWGEGLTKRAQPLLLSLEAVAKPFADVSQQFLYRGFLPSRDQWEQLHTIKQFEMATPAETPLASWSLSRKAVKEFMWGFEDPWVLIRKPTATLDVFINKVEFYRRTQPFQNMHTQQEVIVKMPPTMTISRREIATEDWRRHAN